MPYDSLQWYTQNFESQISSTFFHCFLGVQCNMEFSFPLSNFFSVCSLQRVKLIGWSWTPSKNDLVNSFFPLRFLCTFILFFIQFVPNIRWTSLIWKLSSFAGSKAQDLLWLCQNEVGYCRENGFDPLQPYTGMQILIAIMLDYMIIVHDED